MVDYSRERRGGGNFRGRGGPRGGGNRPRREYERHSGSDKTGVKAVEKRDGFGPHNWGDEISSQLDQPEAQQTDEVAEQGQRETGGQEETPVDNTE